MSEPGSVVKRGRPRLSRASFDLRHDVPEARDPGWPEASRELRDFIGKAATIDRVVDWGERSGLGGTRVRQVLAWLSLQGLVHYDVERKTWLGGPPDESGRSVPEDPYRAEAYRLLVSTR